MSCCCCCGGKTGKSTVSCLGRCDIPKHHCLDKREVCPGPVPKNMGWLYTAKTSPEHQLRCGWRPGHISCTVLRRIEQHNCMKSGECCSPCSSCGARCGAPCPTKTCCNIPCRTGPVCPSPPCCNKPCASPLLRIARHGGQYSILTEPSDIPNSPSSPYPLKYVLNTDPEDDGKGKYSVEAKFNDYQFDYTCSQTSFVIDFTPPDQRCFKPCPKYPPCAGIC